MGAVYDSIIKSLLLDKGFLKGLCPPTSYILLVFYLAIMRPLNRPFRLLCPILPHFLRGSVGFTAYHRPRPRFGNEAADYFFGVVTMVVARLSSGALGRSRGNGTGPLAAILANHGLSYPTPANISYF